MKTIYLVYLHYKVPSIWQTAHYKVTVSILQLSGDLKNFKKKFQNFLKHIRVDDCKAQRYRTTFNVEQFVLKNGGNLGEESQIEELINFDLGTLVNDETWVNSIKIGDREAIMEHAEGAALTVNSLIKLKKKIFFKVNYKNRNKA